MDQISTASSEHDSRNSHGTRFDAKTGARPSHCGVARRRARGQPVFFTYVPVGRIVHLCGQRHPMPAEATITRKNTNRGDSSQHCIFCPARKPACRDPSEPTALFPPPFVPAKSIWH